MSTASEYRQQATEQRGLMSNTTSLKESGQHRKRAEAYESLAAAEDWLNGAVSPLEDKAMPVYSLDIQQRFARIAKQRADEAVKSKVLSLPKLAERAHRKARTAAASVFKLHLVHPSK